MKWVQERIDVFADTTKEEWGEKKRKWKLSLMLWPNLFAKALICTRQWICLRPWCSVCTWQGFQKIPATCLMLHTYIFLGGQTILSIIIIVVVVAGDDNGSLSLLSHAVFIYVFIFFYFSVGKNKSVRIYKLIMGLLAHSVYIHKNIAARI